MFGYEKGYLEFSRREKHPDSELRAFIDSNMPNSLIMDFIGMFVRPNMLERVAATQRVLDERTSKG